MISRGIGEKRERLGEFWREREREREDDKLKREKEGIYFRRIGNKKIYYFRFGTLRQCFINLGWFCS